MKSSARFATIYGIEEIAGIASSASSADRLAMTVATATSGRLAMTAATATGGLLTLTGAALPGDDGVATRAAGASRALVMELIEGEDLSAHIARGPIPIAEALPIARQIAEALEAARSRARE